MHEGLHGIEYLTVIAGRKQKTELLDALTQSGALFMHTAYGKSSVHTQHWQEMLGLVPEVHKVVITCFISRDKLDNALKMLERDFHFDKPNTGIAFAIPIEKFSV